MHALLCPLAFLIALASAVCAGNVHVVDVQGTGLTQIQSGVDVAVDGDVVLVKSGIYASFVVPNKGIAIVADTGADVRVLGAIRARNLAAGKTLLLSGLHAEGAYVPALIERRGLYLVDMHGHVRLQDCTVRGASASPCATSSALDGWDAVHAERCADLAFLDCTVSGGRSGADGNGAVGWSGSGIAAWASHLTLNGCVVSGGTGQTCCDGGSGGSGILLRESSVLYAMDTPIRAGHGGSGTCPPCSSGGNGGTGIWMRELSAAWLIQSPVQMGYGGGAYGGFLCTDGFDGQTINGDSGAFVHSPPWELRPLTAPSVVRAGTPATFGFDGDPFERVELFLVSRSGFQLVLAWEGVLQVEPPEPRRRMIVGHMPGLGVHHFPLDLPLPPGQQATVVHTQALYVDTVFEVGRTRLSPARSVVVLDPAF